MKNLLIAIVLLLTVSSCLPDKKDKDKDPEPELAGTYQISSLIIGTDTVVPSTIVSSASATVTRPSDTRITVRASLTGGGSTTLVEIGDFIIRKSSGRGYDVLDVSTNARRGSIDGTDLTLNYTGNTGLAVSIVARK